MLLECIENRDAMTFRQVPVENAQYIYIARLKRFSRLYVFPENPDGPTSYPLPHAVASALRDYLVAAQKADLSTPRQYSDDEQPF